MGQGHISFNREVISALLNPTLLKTDALSNDAKVRAQKYMSLMETPMGAYTSNSKGFGYAREKIAEFIQKRDNVPAFDAGNIYLTNGAGEGVKLLFNMLIGSKRDGIMIPIPQYPLYSALITLNGGTLVPYYLDEAKNWALDVKDVKKQIKLAHENNLKLKCIVVINPGNPTGQVLSKENIEEIIDICYKNQILIVADEVYQNNVYKEGIEFQSFRKILNTMPTKVRDNVELVSLNSVSKGLLGECGFRGGYMEVHNLDSYASEQIYKLKSIELCSNTIGQLTALLMVDPPQRGVESEETVAKYEKEKNDIFDGLRTRAQLLTSTFNQMQNVKCSEVQGAMYAFP